MSTGYVSFSVCAFQTQVRYVSPSCVARSKPLRSRSGLSCTVTTKGFWNRLSAQMVFPPRESACVACRRGFLSRGLACQRVPLGAVAEWGFAMPNQDIPRKRKPGPFSPGRQSILVSPGAGFSHAKPKISALTGNYFVHRGARYLLTPSEGFRAGAPRL